MAKGERETEREELDTGATNRMHLKGKWGKNGYQNLEKRKRRERGRAVWRAA